MGWFSKDAQPGTLDSTSTTVAGSPALAGSSHPAASGTIRSALIDQVEGAVAKVREQYQAKLNEANAAGLAVETELTNLKASMAQAQTQTAAQVQQFNAKIAELQARANAAEQTGRQAAELQAQLQKVTQELQTLKQASQAQLTQMQQLLTAKTQELQNAQSASTQALTVKSQELQKVNAELQALKNKATADAKLAGDGQARIKQLETELATAVAQRNQIAEERDQAIEARAVVEQELTSFQKDLDEIANRSIA